MLAVNDNSSLSDYQESQIIQRKNASKENNICVEDDNIWDESIIYCEEDNNTSEYKEPKFTLMEEILLIGLKDKQGYISFWNDSVSKGLRGCILVELGLRGKIALGKSSVKQKALVNRRIIVKNGSLTGDTLLDEVLKLMKDCDPPVSVYQWMKCLCGDTWNPLNLKYYIKNVRERTAKNLVEKGVLSTDKTSFLIFDLMTHPLINVEAKTSLIKKIQEAILVKWSSDPHRMDPRILSLIYLARASEVLELALKNLCDQDYNIVSKRISDMENWNLEELASKGLNTEIYWAVFAYFSDQYSFL